MRVAIGAPGNGTVLKDGVKAYLDSDPRVSDVVDFSTPEVTYPALSVAVAEAVVAGDFDRAILVCGTGIGTAIAANKVPGARAATAHELVGVRGAVENYDAQILCFGQNVIAAPEATALVDVWLDARHDPASPYGPKLDELKQLDAH